MLGSCLVRDSSPVGWSTSTSRLLELLKLLSIMRRLWIFLVPAFLYFGYFQKYLLDFANQIHIGQLSPQLSCRDTCQIWTWYTIKDQCLITLKKLHQREKLTKTCHTERLLTAVICITRNMCTILLCVLQLSYFQLLLVCSCVFIHMLRDDFPSDKHKLVTLSK